MHINLNPSNRIDAEKHERYMPISFNVINFGMQGHVACIGCNPHKWVGAMGSFSCNESSQTHYFLIKEEDSRCNEAVRCLNSGEEWTGQEYDYFAVEGSVDGKVRTFFIDANLYFNFLK